MDKKLILTDHLISCAGERIQESGKEQGILVQEGKIVRIEDRDFFAEIIRRNEAEVFDMRGYYVLPGLIDGHLHLSFSSSSQPLNELYGDSDETCLLRMVQAAGIELRSGVTTVRDSGARGMSILKLRDFIQKGEMQGLSLIHI